MHLSQGHGKYLTKCNNVFEGEDKKDMNDMQNCIYEKRKYILGFFVSPVKCDKWKIQNVDNILKWN